jgi:hypothetical protein
MNRNLIGIVVLVAGMFAGLAGCGGRSEPVVVTPDPAAVTPESDPNYDPEGGGKSE